jgi:L-ribulose-5-phosphate 3-epimerase
MFHSDRRDFLTYSASLVAGTLLPRALPAAVNQRETPLSLSERSLSRGLTGGELDHLDFPRVAREEFGFAAVDYASRFFKDQAEDEAYLTQMNKRAGDQGVRQILLLVDGEGNLAAADAKARTDAVRNHRKWIGTAQTLGCRAVCLPVTGEGTAKDQSSRAIESLGQLAEFAAELKVNVLVANDAGAASNPAWLIEVLKQVDSSRCAAFPKFNGFRVGDPYEGMARLMKLAKGVCATARDFNGQGNETKTDFSKMLKIVLEAGYRGYISLEYQGTKLEEFEGIRATKTLLEKYQTEAVSAGSDGSNPFSFTT